MFLLLLLYWWMGSRMLDIPRVRTIMLDNTGVTPMGSNCKTVFFSGLCVGVLCSLVWSCVLVLHVF